MKMPEMAVLELSIWRTKWNFGADKIITSFDTRRDMLSDRAVNKLLSHHQNELSDFYPGIKKTVSDICNKYGNNKYYGKNICVA